MHCAFWMMEGIEEKGLWDGEEQCRRALLRLGTEPDFCTRRQVKIEEKSTKSLWRGAVHTAQAVDFDSDRQMTWNGGFFGLPPDLGLKVFLDARLVTAQRAKK
jgi:hypothetical protein